MQMKELKVEGMSCHHCVNTIEKALKNLKGIHTVEVDLHSEKVKVCFNQDETNIGLIIKAIEDAGYTVLL